MNSTQADMLMQINTGLTELSAKMQNNKDIGVEYRLGYQQALIDATLLLFKQFKI